MRPTIHRPSRLRRAFKAPAITVLAAALLLAGCTTSAPAGGKETGGAKPAAAATLKELAKDEKAAIKVMFYDKNYFFQQYGNLFSAKFPNIDVQVVNMQVLYGPDKDYKTELKKLIDTEKPDVIMVQDASQLEELGVDGKLFALDDVIKQDKFDIDQIHPSVIEMIKTSGNGKIFGLAPSYYSNALYYNKDLFDKYGVPMPTNKMAWADMLALAKRFPTDGKPEERIYGLSAYAYSNKDVGFSYANAIGTAKGLRLVDPNAMALTLQTDGWKQALQLTVDALKSGALYVPKAEANMNQTRSYEDYLKSNPFVTGKVAMAIDGSYLMDNLARAKETIKDLKTFNWDMVTVPVDPQNPDESNSMGLSNLFAVSANASNTRAAWELVKYINSDEMARIQSKSSQELMTRTAYMKEKDGHSLEPFYLLKPSTTSLRKDMEKAPISFYSAFSPIANTEIQAAVDGKKSVDEALKSMQEQGQAALTKAKADQDAKNDNEKNVPAK